MEIKVIVVLEERTRECIEKLADALSGGIKVSAHSENVHVTDGEPEKDSGKSPDVPADGTQPQHQKEPADGVKDKEKVEHEPGATDMLPVSDEVPKATTPAYTDEQLTAACVEASRLGLGSQVRELIRGTFKVSKVSEIPDGLRDGFIGDLRGLGVRI